MGFLKMDLFISKISHQVDGNVDIDCCVTLENVDEDGNSLSEPIEIDSSASLTDALDGIYELSIGGDYTDEELMGSHQCLSLLRDKLDSLISVIEQRVEVKGEVNV
jgi:hypothetical protein